MPALEFALEVFKSEVYEALVDDLSEGQLKVALEIVAELFVESFQYSRSNGRPFESLDRHEDFWRGTGELNMAIDEARTVVGEQEGPEEEGAVHD